MICLLCQSSNVKTFAEKPEIFICGDCDNAFRSPLCEKADYATKIPMPDSFSTILRNKHHHKFIEKNVGFNNIKRLLEIGSGDGALIRYFRKMHKDIEITVIEPGSSFCDDLRKIDKVTVINDYIEKVRISHKYDLVIMSHVLEHLEDPVQTIKYIHSQFMQEGSFLYIDVPSKDYELRSKAATKVAPMMHLFFFSGLGLKRILAESGFSEQKTKGSKYSTLPVGFIKRMEKIGRLTEYKPPPLQLLWYKALNRLSVPFLSAFRRIFAIPPRELSLEKIDFRYNNLAIITSK